MNNKRHKYRNGEPTATFEELTYAEQAKSINTTELNLEKMKKAHDRRAKKEDRA